MVQAIFPKTSDRAYFGKESPTAIVMEYLGNDKEAVEARAHVDCCFKLFQRTFLAPLPGLPDSRIPIDPQLKTMRPRVAQPAGEMGLCLKWAFDRIRGHLGPSSEPERTQEGWIEQRFRDIARKDEIMNLFFASDNRNLQHLTKEDAKALIADPSPIMEASRPRALEFLQNFCAQIEYENLQEYASNQNSKERIRLERHFLGNFGNVDELDLRSVVPFNDDTRSPLSLKETAQTLRLISDHTCTSLYQLKHSTWHPDCPITCLIRSIDRHGPHMVKGTFGPLYYAEGEEPFTLPDKVGGREVWAWSPKAKRVTLPEGMIHSVVIVGADSEFVYYEDTAVDGSDPDHPEKTRVFATSHKGLRRKLYDLSGIKVIDQIDESPLFPERIDGGNNYALHGDFQNNY